MHAAFLGKNVLIGGSVQVWNLRIWDMKRPPRSSVWPRAGFARHTRWLTFFFCRESLMHRWWKWKDLGWRLGIRERGWKEREAVSKLDASLNSNPNRDLSAHAHLYLRAFLFFFAFLLSGRTFSFCFRFQERRDRSTWHVDPRHFLAASIQVEKLKEGDSLPLILLPSDLTANVFSSSEETTKEMVSKSLMREDPSFFLPTSLPKNGSFSPSLSTSSRWPYYPNMTTSSLSELYSQCLMHSTMEPTM